MATTRKVVISAFGDASNLAVVSAPMPAPARNEVQVAVVYSGFSGADVNMRLGWYPMQRAAPLTPGYCFVGRVAANGPGSSRFAPGAVVAAVTVYDAQSELVNIPEKHLVPVPQGVGLQTACALPLDWNSAYGMVMRTASVSAGQRVFVHGLSGAVGYAVMALCQLQGAVVYGTASQRNHDELRRLGAHPFVYTDKAWIGEMQALGGAHAVFDPLGFESYDESYAILCTAAPSRLVGYGGNLTALTGGKRRHWLPYVLKLMLRNAAVWSSKATSFYYISRDDKNFQPDLAALMNLAQEGRVQVPIKHVWALDDIREAHESWGKLHGMGSILVRVSDDATA
ncbi:Protein indc11 [Tolypocladium ophioglossoides CBS 100239]|uniref:Protein indc11 n=1 Tax=Tolypocladium ophioglossoides (strain CBS 100239) TaxID=1163406 RepID=A0A0L0N7H4_TOLOC|nr:Protein indc11 [Tolypocladium ophioglossoides CBS 100239]